MGMTLRLFGTSDTMLRMLLGELELSIPSKQPVFPKERRVLVPYDKDGNRAQPGAPRMWWDLSNGATIKVTDGHNIQGCAQPAFKHIGLKSSGEVKLKGRSVKTGPGNGIVSRRSDNACCLDVSIEGASMKLGLWWIDCARNGEVEKLPIVNRQPKFE